MLLYLVQPLLRATVRHDSWTFLLQAFMPVRLLFFTHPSMIVPLLHRRMAGIFKLFTPLASFSYAT